MLQIRELTKIYNSKSNKEVVALDDINLSFKNKGLAFILGPSGCGKTTLMNMIGGIDIPTHGTIEIDNKPIGITEEELDTYRNQYVGFVFQDFNLLENLNIYDNLSLVCFDIEEDEKKDKIAHFLTRVGLEGYEERYPNELSGGQIQRVAIARALLKDSYILLADEPTGNLNQKMSKEIFSIFKEISKEKLVIIVSHNEELANSYADRIISIRDGEILEDKIINDYAETAIKEKKTSKTINKKTIIKMALENIKSNKTDVIFSSLILFICFLCISVTFSLMNYSRVDTDIKNLKSLDEINNFSLERYTYNDVTQRYITSTQVNKIKEEYSDFEYIQNGKITSSTDLINFGFEFYDNYNELKQDGIYVFEYKIKSAIQNGKLFYDEEGKNVVENTEEINYSKLTNTYMSVDSYVTLAFSPTYLRVDGIIKDLTENNFYAYFETNEENRLHQYKYHIQNQMPIFYLKDSKYDEINNRLDLLMISSFKEGPLCVSANGIKFEKKDIWYGNLILAGNANAMITDDGLFYGEDLFGTGYNSLDNVFKVQNDNEIYLSLGLYNLIFNESSTTNYYIEQTSFDYPGTFVMKNKPRHIGETISLDILDFYFPDAKINYNELILKGVLFSNDNDYGEIILMSSNCYNEIYEFASRPFVYIKKDSIKDISKFVRVCAKYTVRPDYICSDELDAFEFNTISTVRFIFSILSTALAIVAFMMMYNFINRQIKRKIKEFGVLKAIGIKTKDIASIFYTLIQIICLTLIVIIVPMSFIATTIINNLIVAETYVGFTIIYYKWWYSLITIAFIGIVMLIASSLTIKKLKKMKAIQLIRNN